MRRRAGRQSSVTEAVEDRTTREGDEREREGGRERERGEVIKGAHCVIRVERRHRKERSEPGAKGTGVYFLAGVSWELFYFKCKSSFCMGVIAFLQF